MANALIDIALLAITRALSALLGLFSVEHRVRILYYLLRAVFIFVRRPLRVARSNLAQVFPDRGEADREALLRQSLLSFARLIVDALRLKYLDEDWVRSHVQHEVVPEYALIKSQAHGKGVLVATGHLSSFELLAHSAACFGFPMAFVARRLPFPRLNRWLCEVRERRGNRVIDREGAVRTVLSLLEGGTDVGVLFDHNVTRNHAVFVPFLGRAAATTKLIGLAALRTNCPLCVACIQYLSADRYRIKLAQCEIEDIRANDVMSAEEKGALITERASLLFERFVLEDPGQWFWIHARWKTRPLNESRELVG
ncbi:MAG: hypothetical protein QY326_04720 [Bdellovibrionota bacterium]|nr:MAG: hypothetical protein QY326_04720 [Bdellovibrionota bacterium]